MMPDAENTLPPNQAPIMTQAMRRLFAFFHVLVSGPTQTGYPMMGVVTGLPGMGKTIAVQAFLDQLTDIPGIGVPTCVAIKVAPRATAKSVAAELLQHISGQRTKHNIFETETVVVEAIKRHFLDLIVVDEGDALTIESFEMLRHIFDRSGCPIVIVGLPAIRRVIGSHEKFRSRVGCHLYFAPPTSEEIRTTILPNLIVPHWSFDASDLTDAPLGQFFTQHAGWSLRTIRTILTIASQLAQHQHLTRITLPVLHESLAFVQEVS